METLQNIRAYLLAYPTVSFFIFVIVCLIAKYLWDLVNKSQRDVQKVHGSARFAEQDELENNKLLHDGFGGMILGCVGNQFVDAENDSHAVVVAPTRSGKGVSIIIPTLLSYRGSIIVNDPKGENLAITARRREVLGSSIVPLDPWELSDFGSAQMNPLEYINIDSSKLISQLNKLAAAICGNIPTDGDNSYFYLAARSFVRFCILYVIVKHKGTEKANLVTVRDLVFCTKDEVISLLEESLKMPDAKGKLSLLAGSLQKTAIDSKGEFSKAFQSVLSNAEVYFDFLLDDQLAHFFSKNTDDYRLIKNESATVYIIASPEEQEK